MGYTAPGSLGSDRVKLYVRTAQVDAASTWATQAAKQTDLEALLEELQKRLKRPTAASSSSTAPPSQLDVVLSEVTKSLPDIPSLAPEVLASNLNDEASRMEAAKTASPNRYVVSGRYNIWHKVLVGPDDGRLSDWHAVCGWAFGKHAKHETRTTSDALPTDAKKLCQICFPSEREAR